LDELRLSRTQTTKAVLVALTGFLMALPVTISALVASRPYLNWRYLGSCIAIDAIIVIIAILQLPRLKIGKSFLIGANAMFALSVAATLATAFLEMGAGKNKLFLCIFVLNALFIGLSGSLKHQAVGFLLISAIFIWTLVKTAVNGEMFLVYCLIYLSLFLVVQIMSYVMINDLLKRLEIDYKLRRISEASSSQSSISNALLLSIPILRTILPIQRFVVVAGDDGGMIRVVFAWPEPNLGDELLLLNHEARIAIFEGTTVFKDDTAYLPAGFGPLGAMLGVLEFYKPKWKSKERYGDVCDSLIPVLSGITSRSTYLARLEEQSRTDALTGIGNRRVLQETLEKEIDRCSRYGGVFSALMLDIDHFKSYNDRFGHLEGDKVLQHVSAMLVERLREQDFVARFGGEEFCIILPQTDRHAASAVAGDILQLVKKLPLTDIVTCSIGIAQWLKGQSAETFLRCVDEALYLAKARGRNQFAFAMK
jgi:diguanylate cyclase (GGDEF)-like protein